TIEEMEIPTGEESFTFTVSLGVSTYCWREHGVVAADLLFEAADRALLRAKAAEKNQVVFMDLLQAAAEKDGPRQRPGFDGALPVESAPGS
ncbi:MAG: GGDEF domain-containing protein, partial [Armatimonadota bacterium]|nr:GGDEF domain-containing protein [Armatimonadota bacterium]